MKPSQVTAAATQKAEEKSAEAPATLTGPVSFEQIRDAWPAILQTLGSQSRVAGIVMVDTVPVSFGEDKVLAVAFPNSNTMNNAVKSGHDDRLRLVIQNLFHVDVRIDPTVDPNRAQPAKPKKQQQLMQVKHPQMMRQHQLVLLSTSSLAHLADK
jgi:DNA polymerase III subunit gamma/tau